MSYRDTSEHQPRVARYFASTRKACLKIIVMFSAGMLHTGNRRRPVGQVG